MPAKSTLEKRLQAAQAEVTRRNRELTSKVLAVNNLTPNSNKKTIYAAESNLGKAAKLAVEQHEEVVSLAHELVQVAIKGNAPMKEQQQAFDMYRRSILTMAQEFAGYQKDVSKIKVYPRISARFAPESNMTYYKEEKKLALTKLSLIPPLTLPKLGDEAGVVSQLTDRVRRRITPTVEEQFEDALNNVKILNRKLDEANSHISNSFGIAEYNLEASQAVSDALYEATKGYTEVVSLAHELVQVAIEDNAPIKEQQEALERLRCVVQMMESDSGIYKQSAQNAEMYMSDIIFNEEVDNVLASAKNRVTEAEESVKKEQTLAPISPRAQPKQEPNVRLATLPSLLKEKYRRLVHPTLEEQFKDAENNIKKLNRRKRSVERRIAKKNFLRDRYILYITLKVAKKENQKLVKLADKLVETATDDKKKEALETLDSSVKKMKSNFQDYINSFVSPDIELDQRWEFEAKCERSYTSAHNTLQSQRQKVLRSSPTKDTAKDVVAEPEKDIAPKPAEVHVTEHVAAAPTSAKGTTVTPKPAEIHVAAAPSSPTKDTAKDVVAKPEKDIAPKPAEVHVVKQAAAAPSSPTKDATEEVVAEPAEVHVVKQAAVAPRTKSKKKTKRMVRMFRFSRRRSSRVAPLVAQKHEEHGGRG